MFRKASPPPPRPRWYITREALHQDDRPPQNSRITSSRINERLDAGFEPFAATDKYIWFRKLGDERTSHP